MPDRLPFLLDCDTGIDDGLALLWLLAEPGVRLVAITTVSGNTTAARAARNTLDLLALAGHTGVPVAVGAQGPLRGRYSGGSARLHGTNGVGGVVLPRSPEDPVEVPAAELIVRTARAHAGRLRLLTIGPLTNLAVALALEPDLPALVAEVTVMGGAALVPGGVTPVAEANVHADPDAAAAVLAAPWPVTLVTMDATMPQRLEEADLELLAGGGPAARAVAAMLDHYVGAYEPRLGRRCCPIHDPLAAAVATAGIRPTSAPVVQVEVDTGSGPGRGQVICDLRGLYTGYPPQPGAHVRVVLGVEGRFADLLVARTRPL